jgi:hypothetical protein
MAGCAKALDDRCGGLAGSERDDDTLAAPAADLRCADDRVGRVVSAFHDDIRPEVSNQLERRVFVEDDDGVDGLEASEHVRAFGLRPDGPLRALEAPNAGVAVEADDERIAKLTRTAQNVEVTRVKEVEHPVREDDTAGGSSAPGTRTVPVDDLPSGIEGTQKLLSTRG